MLHCLVDCEGLSALRSLRDDDLGAARVHVFDDPVTVISLVGQQRAERDARDQRCDTHGVISVAGQKDEADKISKRGGQGKDLCRPPAFGLSDGLILSPPLAPCA